MVSAADAQRLRASQAGIRVLVESDLADFFASLNLSRPESARDALLEFVPLLVETYGDSAAAVSADWYDDQRSLARVGGAYRASMQPSPYLDSVEGTVRRAAGSLFTDVPTTALSILTPSVGKYVLAAGRQTIIRSTDRDPRASGWQRVTRPGACDFCRLLHGRGGVYRESTVHFASHKDCGCAAVPSWDRSAPEVDVAAYEASKRAPSAA